MTEAVTVLVSVGVTVTVTTEGGLPVGDYATHLVVGVGGRAGVSVAEVCALIEETLRGPG